MSIELPGWAARLFNLMGLFKGAGWSNAREGDDGAAGAGTVYRQHATNLQPAVTDAKAHGQRATSAVQGTAGTDMTQTVDHPQGAINNLVDHHKGALVTALIGGGVVSIGLLTYKIYKLTDGAITLGEMASSALVPGGEAAWPEELAVGRLAQNAITNTTANLIMGGA